MFAESLTILGGILSGPVTIYWLLSLIILFISSAVACENQSCNGSLGFPHHGSLQFWEEYLMNFQQC